MIALRTVSVDDLIDTLTYVARLADDARARLDKGHALTGSKALWTIRNEALDAVTRAEMAE